MYCVLLLLFLCSLILFYLYRRIRELNENNTKKFLDERRRQSQLQSRQRDTLKKQHQEQLEALIKDMNKVSLELFIFLIEIQSK